MHVMHTAFNTKNHKLSKICIKNGNECEKAINNLQLSCHFCLVQCVYMFFVFAKFLWSIPFCFADIIANNKKKMNSK